MISRAPAAGSVCSSWWCTPALVSVHRTLLILHTDGSNWKEHWPRHMLMRVASHYTCSPPAGGELKSLEQGGPGPAGIPGLAKFGPVAAGTGSAAGAVQHWAPCPCLQQPRCWETAQLPVSHGTPRGRRRCYPLLATGETEARGDAARLGRRRVSLPALGAGGAGGLVTDVQGSASETFPPRAEVTSASGRLGPELGWAPPGC